MGRGSVIMSSGLDWERFGVITGGDEVCILPPPTLSEKGVGIPTLSISKNLTAHPPPRFYIRGIYRDFKRQGSESRGRLEDEGTKRTPTQVMNIIQKVAKIVFHLKVEDLFLEKNLNASQKGLALGGNIGCRDKAFLSFLLFLCSGRSLLQMFL